jgi:Peptidase_C39 like family
MKKSHLFMYVLAALAVAAVAVDQIKNHYQTAVIDVPEFNHQISKNNFPPPSGKTGTPGPNPKFIIPSSLLLTVPFTPQAPTGNWDTIHNEDCEEASAVMANAFYSGPHDAKLDPAYVEGQLTKLTDWEMKNFGYNLDITSEETVQMIKANYDLQSKILYGFTEQNIKNELAQNHLVLLPANGRLLGNPNYRQPGPKYHMLVIRGYAQTSIITNDPGTRNGLNYSYDFNTLYKANGEWDHQTNSVDLDKKNIIVVWK